eukprot:209093-Amorphochlora_amoeboformis.AAC.3
MTEPHPIGAAHALCGIALRRVAVHPRPLVAVVGPKEAELVAGTGEILSHYQSYHPVSDFVLSRQLHSLQYATLTLDRILRRFESGCRIGSTHHQSTGGGVWFWGHVACSPNRYALMWERRKREIGRKERREREILGD